MTSGTHYSRFQQGIIRGFYEYRDDAMVQRLQEIISDLALESDKGKQASLWKSAGMTLAKTSYDPMKAARVVADRNVELLAKVVAELLNKAAVAKATGPGPAAPNARPGPAAPLAPAASAAAATARTMTMNIAVAEPTADDLKSALRAFKKRLKVTRLDAESGLSSRALTGGKKSNIVAITPPNDFARPVWEALVKDGKLKHAGSGLYELIGE
ncbi:MAG: hypothetical protein ACT4PL_09275 [Phycisphaerales bacterium]